jgi:hypothetical protein
MANSAVRAAVLSVDDQTIRVAVEWIHSRAKPVGRMLFGLAIHQQLVIDYHYVTGPRSSQEGSVY